MFTGHTIELAEAAKDLPLHVVRSAPFSYVGKVPTVLPRRVVPCGAMKHIEAASAFSDIAGIITTAELAHHVPKRMGLAIASDPMAASLHLHERICDLPGFLWEHFDSRIHPSAKIHPSAVIAQKDVIIGAGAHVGPGSVIFERSIIEQKCHVGVGVVVGLEAFEIFEEASPRRILKQAGGVLMQEGATVLAKTTIVRSTFGGFTRIEKNVMIDVLIHIAHDVVIGEGSTVIACAEISGRCELGAGSYIGPNACIRNGVKIGAGSTVSMGAVVTQDVPHNQVVSGNFAVPHGDWLRFVKSLGRTAEQKAE